MDDETGWNTILVDGWGALVRAAVCDRIEDAFVAARGVLWTAAVEPDEAPSHAVERLHAAIIEAIATETGADLDHLGSQAAWATYDDVWAELGRRCADGGSMEVVASAAEAEVLDLLARLPTDAVEHAGALRGDGALRTIRIDGHLRLDVDGVHRWLATEPDADEATRARARSLVAAARRTA